MYADCMFCSRPLGANAVLETFPIGRRVAFDADRGRLWVVCRRCERWNLSPLEERWEAVEACERIFRATRLQVSTENVGLARHAEGLELVRIGKPLRPEFAAWRYGDQFGRRRKRAIAYGAAGAAVVGAVVVGGAVAGVAMGPLMAQSGNLIRGFQYGWKPLEIEADTGEVLKLTSWELERMRIEAAADGWKLTLKRRKLGGLGNTVIHTFEGEEAARTVGLALTRLNHAGGSRETVQSAVREIEHAAHPEAYLDVTARRMASGDLGGKEGRLGKLPAPTRLALEMSLHEEHERRALEGELKGLELIWRREEEIAAIADDLLLPEGTQGSIDRMRGDGAPPESSSAG